MGRLRSGRKEAIICSGLNFSAGLAVPDASTVAVLSGAIARENIADKQIPTVKAGKRPNSKIWVGVCGRGV